MRHTTQLRHIRHQSEKVASGVLEEVRSKSKEMAGRAKERGAEIIDDAQASGQRAWKDAKGWVARNPGWALGTAFVAGALAKALGRHGKS